MLCKIHILLGLLRGLGTLGVETLAPHSSYGQRSVAGPCPWPS